MGQGVYCGLEVEGNMIAREPFYIRILSSEARKDDDDDMTLNARDGHEPKAHSDKNKMRKICNRYGEGCNFAVIILKH